MKQKIAFCIPNMIIGGVETVFVTLVDELLKQKNIELSVITHANIRKPLYANWLKNKKIPVYVYYPLCNWFEERKDKWTAFPLKQIRKISFSLYKKYRRAIVRFSGRFNDIDVFIDYKNMEFFKELTHYKQPKITWLHGAPSYFENNGSFSRLPIYDHIIALTQEFVTDFLERHPEYTGKISQIYNPIDATKIRELANKAPTGMGKYFAHVSRLVAGKDIKTVLDAFELFSAEHPDVKLYIVGDGDKADEFKAYAKTLKSNKNIVFTGAKENPYGIMRGAVANILSSEYEGLPTVCIESQILGVPMIASNCKCGPKEILEYGRSGMLFKIGDADALAKLMANVYSHNIDTPKTISTAKKSLSRFSPEEICKQIIDLCCDTNLTKQ